MIIGFPNPYPDEMLYSVLARYCIRTASTSPKQAIQELFRSTTISAIMDLPSGLDMLVQNMQGYLQYDVDGLIKNMTHYPYYAPFLSEDRRNKIIASMKGTYGGNIHSRIGIMASSVCQSRYFRICPICMTHDLENYGEPYWHRIHQLPGVEICINHQCPIYYTDIFIHGFNKHEYTAANEKMILSHPTQGILATDIYEELYMIAQQIKWLMDEYEKVQGVCFHDVYLARLKELGLATPTGRVDQKEFMNAFKKYYHNKTLQILQSEVDEDSESNWLSMIVRKHRKVFHPLRHILLITFLYGGMKNFYESDKEYLPFGKGKWYCLNPAANHYKEKVVTDLKISMCINTKCPVGTFACECGFVYSRRGPDLSVEDQFRIGRIKNFGSVWENKLKELVETKKMGLRETARHLGADSNTVKKYAKKLGFITYWEVRSEDKIYTNTSARDNTDLIRKQKQNSWLILQKQYPNRKKTELRQIKKDIYIWLYRNDRSWLDNHSPKKQVPCNEYKRRVDWGERDEQILKKVKDCIKKEMKSKDKPQRISASRIGKELGVCALLEKHIDKLLRTKEYIENHKESQEMFQKRRIRWAVQMLDESNEDVKPWKVIRMVGLQPEYAKALEEYIEIQIKRYQKTKIQTKVD